MTDTRWVTTTLAASPGQVTSVPILPIGDFKLPNHSRRKDGKLSITPEIAAELVANFDAKVLKTEVRFDLEHDFREAAAWITGLSVGTFAHAVTGQDMPGIIAEVEWTPMGVKALSEKTYRYVSAAFGPYEDEETGKKYANVLKAVALTNDPAMKMLPAVTLSDPELSGADVVSLDDEDDPEPEPEPVAAALADTPEEKPQTVTAKGGSNMSDQEEVVMLTEQIAQLKAENDRLTAEAEALESEKREARATELCDKLSERGWDETSRERLHAILLADAVESEAVAELVEGIEIVPTTPAADEQPKPADEEAELTEADKHIAKLLDVDTSKLKK